MARQRDPVNVSQDERADSTRDVDQRNIYPGVAGRNPLGDHKSPARTLLFPPRYAGNSRLDSRSYPNPRYGLRKHRTR